MNGFSLTGLLCIFVGGFLAAGAWFRWTIVMNPSKLLPRLFGENIARNVYIIVGLILVIFGIGMIAGLFGG